MCGIACRKRYQERLFGGSDTATLSITVIAEPISLPRDITIGGPVSFESDITLPWDGENGIAYGVKTNDDLVNGTLTSPILSGMVEQ